MPGEDNEFEKAYKLARATDSDDVFFNTLEKAYANQIDFLKGLPEDLYVKLTQKKEPKKPDAVSTLASEQVEDNVRNTTPDAMSTVMRPEFKTTEKASLLSDLKYHISLNKVKAEKKLNKDESVYAVTDFFDKSVGLEYEKKQEGVIWKTGLEYDPFDSSTKLTTNYSYAKRSYKASIYADKDNYGVNLGYSCKATKDSKFVINTSLFKSDSAARLEYRKQMNNGDNIGVGAYWSSKYKEAGVTFRWSNF